MRPRESSVRLYRLGMEKPPRKSTGREITEKVIEGGVGLVPVAGGPLATAFGYAMGFAYGRRMQTWMDDLADTVTRLENRPDLDDLADNDVFVDAVVNATRAAQATHDQVKLEALRNAVCNSIGEDAPVVDEQARFFRLIDQFTGAHIRMLAFAEDPGALVDAAGVERPNYSHASRSTVLELLPEFAGRREWYDRVFKDITEAGLVDGVLHAGQTGNSVWTKMLSPLGQRFLDFIRDNR